MTSLIRIVLILATRILNANCERDSTARGESRGHDGLARCAGFHKIVENAVRDGFVERALIAIRGQIKLKRFAFDAETVGHVIDVDPREVRLACNRTDGSKVIRFKMNPVISFRSGIGKRLQTRFGWRRGKFRVAVPEQC